MLLYLFVFTFSLDATCVAFLKPSERVHAASQVQVHRSGYTRVLQQCVAYECSGGTPLELLVSKVKGVAELHENSYRGESF